MAGGLRTDAEIRLDDWSHDWALGLLAEQLGGYDEVWFRLSRRAHRLQPWCTERGTEENLTSEHAAGMGAQSERALPTQLEDIDVKVPLTRHQPRGGLSFSSQSSTFGHHDGQRAAAPELAPSTNGAGGRNMPRGRSVLKL
ncbi:hypothetical protein GOARA_050_01110 [Gordonia araii NBRC 100433]|uniref:Uncharacterized protein n=1 Tax=Gordonia araii NBRC 100433 TaxID=1073574 RepID=G7H2H3_9ACTN|nr:hypothetical protein GOARA_050_01110 [Gordonia araii NBRC 100433]